MGKEFIVPPANPPCVDYSRFDQNEIGFITGGGGHNPNRDVVAIYRVGSRITGGTPRPDSDIDYLLLHDRDKHYGELNIRFRTRDYRDPNTIYIEHIHFTRRDLQYPANMKGLKQKLIFLHGISGGRELVWGKDVLPKWLSPDIAKLFDEHGINDESVKQFTDFVKKSKTERFTLESPPPLHPDKGGKNRL